MRAIGVSHTACKDEFDEIFDLTAGVYFNFYNTLNSRSAGYTGGPKLSNSRAVSFPGHTGESFFRVRHGENLKKFIMVDVGLEPTTRKTHGLSTTPFICWGIRLVRLTNRKRFTNSLPELNLILISQKGVVALSTSCPTQGYARQGWVNVFFTCSSCSGLGPIARVTPLILTVSLVSRVSRFSGAALILRYESVTEW